MYNPIIMDLLQTGEIVNDLLVLRDDQQLVVFCVYA